MESPNDSTMGALDMVLGVMQPLGVTAFNGGIWSCGTINGNQKEWKRGKEGGEEGPTCFPENKT